MHYVTNEHPASESSCGFLGCSLETARAFCTVRSVRDFRLRSVVFYLAALCPFFSYVDLSLSVHGLPENLLAVCTATF